METDLEYSGNGVCWFFLVSLLTIVLACTETLYGGLFIGFPVFQSLLEGVFTLVSLLRTSEGLLAVSLTALCYWMFI